MRTVFLYHIPKTGGMSIRRSVLAALDRHHVCDNYADERAYEKYDVRSRAGFRFVTGHFPVGIHHHCPVDHALVTVLRDPVERCVSFARMVAKRPAHIFSIHRPTPPLQLLRQRHPELCDAMVKRLAGIGPTGPWPATTNTVKWARQNLAQFTHIGFTDQLARTFAVLSDLLETPLTPSRVNAAPNSDPEGLDEFRAQIAALNQADIDLYNDLRSRSAAPSGVAADQVNCPVEHAATPRWLTATTRLTHGITGWTRATLHIDRAPEEVINARRGICAACPENVPCYPGSQTRCCGPLSRALAGGPTCGCVLEKKAALASERCPVGRW